MTRPITLAEMTDALRQCLELGSQCDLLGRLPFGSRAAASFIESYGDELEAMLGRRPVVERPSYTPSGRGQFGRLQGGRNAVRRSLAVRWTTTTVLTARPTAAGTTGTE